MTSKPKPLKPHKWSLRTDAPCCIGCGKPFQRGDLAIHDGCCSLHWKKECFEQRNKDLKELGLL